jgi:DNA-binding MarR family transcriptional regulator
MSEFKSVFLDASESPGFMLWKVSNLHQRMQRKALSEIGLTPTQFSVLASYFYLYKKCGVVRQIDICQHTGIDKMQVSDVSKALEKDGLIRKMPNPKDNRASLVDVTDLGQEKCNRALKIIEKLDSEFFSMCDNLEALMNELNRLSKQAE